MASEPGGGPAVPESAVEAQDGMSVNPTIHIIDMTNRDGVQTAKLGLAKIEKTLINLCERHRRAGGQCRPAAEVVETGRQICIGECSGINGFRNVSERLEIVFRDDNHARDILDLTRYAHVLKQKPLVADEVRFIARYPGQARTLMTLTP